MRAAKSEVPSNTPPMRCSAASAVFRAASTPVSSFSIRPPASESAASIPSALDSSRCSASSSCSSPSCSPNAAICCHWNRIYSSSRRFRPTSSRRRANSCSRSRRARYALPYSARKPRLSARLSSTRMRNSPSATSTPWFWEWISIRCAASSRSVASCTGRSFT